MLVFYLIHFIDLHVVYFKILIIIDRINIILLPFFSGIPLLPAAGNVNAND